MSITKTRRFYRGGRYGSKTRGRFGSAGRGFSSRSSESNKKTLADHVYQLGSAKQASDYVTVTEFIINHIRVTFVNGGDIGEALEKLEPKDFKSCIPVPEISTKTEEAEQKAEQARLDMLYKARIEVHVVREQHYTTNLVKAFAVIWKQCSKAMRSKIMARKDYEAKVRDNPIELLKAIKEHALGDSTV